MIPLAGWKMVIYGVAVALLSVFSSVEMQAYVAANLPWFGGISGLLIVILRAITSSPIFKKN